jgi:L-ascorbate metabolism protein UlaG (beta-lactamase superfamily)
VARNRFYAGPVSDHFDGERFFNPGVPRTKRGLRDVLRWRIENNTATWPSSVPVRKPVPQARVAGLRITQVGHMTLLVQAGGINILTDPVWSQRASPFSFIGPKRVTEPAIALADLPPIDVVVISHCHYDHFDVASLRQLHAAHAPLFALPLGNDVLLREAVPDARCVVGDWWDRLELAPGLATTLTPAYHWANRWPWDARQMLWCGHFLHTPAGSVWFAGDTGYGTGAMFREMRERLGDCDVALIPIGAYEPRWFMAEQHVNPAEAVQIYLDIGARDALGIHWGTFQLTDEPYEAPAEALAAALAEAGISPERFAAMRPGDVYEG